MLRTDQVSPCLCRLNWILDWLTLHQLPPRAGEQTQMYKPGAQEALQMADLAEGVQRPPTVTIASMRKKRIIEAIKENQVLDVGCPSDSDVGSQLARRAAAASAAVMALCSLTRPLTCRPVGAQVQHRAVDRLQRHDEQVVAGASHRDRGRQGEGPLRRCVTCACCAAPRARL